jgi:hypothetical protein
MYPVETFATDGTDEALGEGVGSWRSDEVQMILTPSERRASSKFEVNLVLCRGSRIQGMHLVGQHRG